MSSAKATEHPETDEPAGEMPASTDALDASDETEHSVNSASTDDRPIWRRVLGRWPVEVWILTALATLTRFAYLYNPRSIVFDETYFRTYGLMYKSGTYYFDLHPPLGKLLIGLWGAVAHVHATATSKDPAVVLRVLPAFAGVVLILVVYYLIRRLSGSRRLATLGAGLLMLDNALLVESRFTLMDSMLLSFGVGAVTVALAARTYTGRAYWWRFVFAAALAGCAVSVKATGLQALALIGLIWLVDVIHEKRWKTWKPALGQLATLVLVPVVIYVAVFTIHFALLPKAGEGDIYMSQAFQATLKGDKNYDPNKHMSFITKFREINHQMSYYETSLGNATHPNASKWYTWPITKRSVYMYYGAGTNGKARYIYEIGNPMVWWGTLLGAAIVFVGMLARPGRFKPYKWVFALLFVAWAANFFPYAFIHRPMFIYHYFYGLIYSIAFVTIGLGVLTGWINEGSRPFTFATRRSTIGYWSILGLALAFFLYFGPTTYGLPLTADGLTDRLWLHTWR